MFRWVLYGFLATLTLILLAAGGIYFLLNRSLPDYTATHQVGGISGPVRIVRDQHAVPHIFGETDQDVFFGLGFVHAQDRLWQMLMFRQAAQGRLSEVFGRATLDTDELMRRLDLNGAAVSTFEVQDSETRAILTAYAQGVNAWLKEIDKSLFHSGAPEFLINDFEIRPWQPFDSLAIMNLQAYELSIHAADETLRARAAQLIPEDRLRDLFPVVPRLIAPDLKTKPIAMADVGSHHESIGRLGEVAASPAMFAGDLGGASNVWAASSIRTPAGGSLLANDPHLSLTAPSIWMLARLELDSGGIIGATIPGMPTMPVGRSASIGWGVTSSFLDDQDLYIERLAPASDEQYLTPDGHKEFRTKDEVISVKGESHIVIESQWTENGPVIPGKYFNLEQILPEDHVASLAWTALGPENTTMSGVLALMRSQTIDEALHAGRLIHSPTLNLMLASKDEIALQLVGAAPRRHLFHETRGIRPSPGWKHRNRWQGYLDYAELPRVRNPVNGVLANTNNRLPARPFPEHLSHTWGDSQRIERLRQLLLETDLFTRDLFKAIQLDDQSYAARTVTSLLGRDLWHTADRPSSDPAVGLRNKALKLLRNWSGKMDEHLPEPLIYAAWSNTVQKLLTRDELGEIGSYFRRLDPLFMERVYRNVDGAGVWCDIRQSTEVETCEQISELALDEALASLTAMYGDDINGWRWGDAHKARHVHRVLTRSKLLATFVDIRQSTSGGDYTINRGTLANAGDQPYANVHGAGYRGIYDFSEPNASYFIIATGQSGHPLSEHYDDLGALWRAGDYITMSLDSEYTSSSAIGTITLEPAS